MTEKDSPLQRLSVDLVDKPNNVYGLLGVADYRNVVDALSALGWSSRASAWDEHEVGNEWCMFVISQPGGSTKLAGVIADERLGDLFEVLSQSVESESESLSLELYGPDGELLRELGQPAG